MGQSSEKGEKGKRRVVDFWRQLDIIDPNEDITEPVTIIGAGGIGSPTVLSLTKMGVREIEVYDYDRIEEHNLPNQFFRIKDIGTEKVKALKSIVKDFTGINIKAYSEMFNGQDIEPGIVISGVDSMQSRKEIWEQVKYNVDAKLYIDARMLGEVCRIYTINPSTPSDISFYEKTLYDDPENEDNEHCTNRAVIYNVFMIASLISNQVKRFYKGEELIAEIIFDLTKLNLLTF
jgi:molybdopterin/thiamine biosynthesis adenylyltransferase